MKNSILISAIILFFASTSTAQIKLISGGSVSIGSSSSPSARLHVHGGSLFSDTTGSITRAPYICGTNSNSTDSTPDYTWYNNSRCGIFHPSDDNIGICMNGAEKFRFTTTGIKNYGNALFLSSPTLTSSTSAALIKGTNSYSSQTAPDYTWYNDDKTGIFHPDTDNIAFTTNGSERMRVTEKGNFLVGSALDTAARVVIDAGTNFGALAMWTNFTTNYAYAHASYVSNSKTKNWVVDWNGTEEFYVYGSGSVWCSSGSYTSDSTLKENVHPLQNARSKVLALRGVSFNFKPEHLNNPQDTFTLISQDPPQTQIGFIAQEVERIVPEVVSTNDHGIKGIAYQNMVALLVEAFKEQNLTIDSLKNQLALCCNAGSQPPGGGSRQANPFTELDKSSSETSGARLDQNAPNPFNTQCEIHFFLPEKSSSKILMVFDMQGTLLKQYILNAKGESSITISGNEYKAGMYLYSLVIDGKEIDTKRMILTK